MNEIIIWKQDGDLSCGINAEGDLFLGTSTSGYNLPDTPENREYILEDFERW